MIRAIAFTLALTFGVSAPQNVQKENRPTLIDIAYADVSDPCPLPEIIVMLKEVKVDVAKPIAKPVVKVKKKLKRKHHTLTQKEKKKLAAAALTKQKDKKTDHHKSKVPDHHKSQTQNPSSSGPLHLTSPPGCG